MKVLIVSRTRMGETVRCIGGLASDGTSVRLLTPSGKNHDTSSPLLVGQLWDLTYSPKSQLIAPHVEDVLVSTQRFMDVEIKPKQYILERVFPWKGSIDKIFDGLIVYSKKHKKGYVSGYVSEQSGVPDKSTGFWIPDSDLRLRDDGEHYDYASMIKRSGSKFHTFQEATEWGIANPGGTITKSPDGSWYIKKDVTKSKESIEEMDVYPPRGMKYVGEESPIKVIPAGTLVRLSLARWWTPDSEPNDGEKCYLQLSGWYGITQQEATQENEVPF